VFSGEDEGYAGVSVERVAPKFAEELAEVVVGVLERRESANRLAHVEGGYCLRCGHRCYFFPFLYVRLRPFLRARAPPPSALRGFLRLIERASVGLSDAVFPFM